ncbi:hypothetical protein KUTeg_012714 [Tegillarca granosa]|uniref:Uncharacterized protein n=1 Tax=Tegillarca granosa TaxID=220873 RepID=A0ABQ9F0B6_TEGGR|nr:hypothetical protein KUTeg_012714 [Tegillarca granosa]
MSAADVAKTKKIAIYRVRVENAIANWPSRQSGDFMKFLRPCNLSVVERQVIGNLLSTDREVLKETAVV